MSRGFVYILTNDFMPDLVKIGMTTRSVEQRAVELYQTGTPGPFKIYESFDCPNCVEVEREVHEELSEYRINDGREFFRCDTEKARICVMNWHRYQVERWVDQFIPDQILVDPDLHIEESDILLLSKGLDVPPMTVANAIQLLNPEELLPALARLKERTEKRKAARKESAILSDLRAVK